MNPIRECGNALPGLPRLPGPVASPAPVGRPAPVSRAEASGATAPAASQPMVPSVLIADNDAAVSGLLAEVLRRAGVEVEQVFDGEAARRRAVEAVPDVLVCDLDMPKMSGIDVLEALRDQPRQPPTLVISGYLDAAIEARLAQLPFVRTVLRKPFDLMAFAQLVRELAAEPGEGTAALGEAGA